MKYAWAHAYFFAKKYNKQYITLDNCYILLYTVYKEVVILDIILNNNSMVPIYEQVAEQIKKNIISGKLKADDVLPSVRTLSNDLKISALTVKKAYDYLEEQGFVVTVHGKGTYIARTDTALAREARLRRCETELKKLVDFAKDTGISKKDLIDLFELEMEEWTDD